jgi:hypothetical protein
MHNAIGAQRSLHLTGLHKVVIIWAIVWHISEVVFRRINLELPLSFPCKEAMRRNVTHLAQLPWPGLCLNYSICKRQIPINLMTYPLADLSSGCCPVKVGKTSKYPASNTTKGKIAISLMAQTKITGDIQLKLHA